MNETEIREYIKAAAVANGLFLEPERVQAVAQHFARTEILASKLESVRLLPEHEMAEIFRPAPFPAEEI